MPPVLLPVQVGSAIASKGGMETGRWHHWFLGLEGRKGREDLGLVQELLGAPHWRLVSFWAISISNFSVFYEQGVNQDPTPTASCKGLINWRFMAQWRREGMEMRGGFPGAQLGSGSSLWGRASERSSQDWVVRLGLVPDLCFLLAQGQGG